MTLQVLLVCSANVCRSPMAAAMLGAASERMGLDLDIHTAGIALHELAVDPMAVQTMAARGLDISEHVPRLVEGADVADADLILTMTREHLRHIATEFPGSFTRTFTLKEAVRRMGERGLPYPFDTAALHDGRTPADLMGVSFDDDIDDPFGGPASAYGRCVTELDAAIGSLCMQFRLARPDVIA